ncbi:nose resistant to fluoxetine protein 6-like isoform X2 [Argiope bruennichi]|nr:nose resistant to fluoxetine protein 6-like isoform X2 [Argiope bruennichi]XP_055945902.1 nose resistant to fluoxetine protein 6-like isoform X2 [Argiope bruennichi]
MEPSLDVIHDAIPWQATAPGIMLNIKDELLAAIQSPVINYQRSPKELTKEAACMICVIIFFVLLAVLGSSITVYECFCKNNKKMSRYEDGDKNIKEVKKKGDGNKYLKRNDWLEDCAYFLKMFCIVKNGSKILRTTSSENQIGCIHGLRFIANAWLILLHTSMAYISTIKDMKEVKQPFELRVSQLMLGGIFSVDIFFVISGFLNGYLFFHKYSKRNGNISWGFFYFKRFARLTPVYMIVLGCYTTLLTYTGNGIIWPTYDTNPVCKKDWWWQLLYINNFEEAENQCTVWGWYLAADMQFYIISPLFMTLLMRRPRLGYALVLTCISGSCAASFVLTYQYNLTEGLSRVELLAGNIRSLSTKFWKYYNIIHSKPYTRIGPYLNGLTLGHYLYKKSMSTNVIRNSKTVLCCGWATTASFMWICFFSLYKKEEVLWETAVYNGTKFLLFSCGVVWIIYVCFTGQAELLNNFLSWKAFLPLSRLSYCSNLTHMIILMKILLQAESIMDFSLITLMSLYLYTSAFTYLVSFTASLFFEMPVLNFLNQLGQKNGGKNSSVTFSVYKKNNQNHSDVFKIS